MLVVFLFLLRRKKVFPRFHLGSGPFCQDKAWAWYKKHAKAVQAQMAYEMAQDNFQKETQQTRDHQLISSGIYGPLAMDPVFTASHDELEQAGVPHSMPMEQFVPPPPPAGDRRPAKATAVQDVRGAQ